MSRGIAPEKAGLSPEGDGLPRVNLCRVRSRCTAAHEAIPRLLLMFSSVKRSSPARAAACSATAGVDESEPTRKPQLTALGLKREGGWKALSPDIPIIVVKLVNIIEQVGLKTG